MERFDRVRSFLKESYMDALTGIMPESWLAWLTAAVTICAALAAVLPAPAEGGNVVYRAVYRLIQWIGFNLYKAKNADDPTMRKTTASGDGKR